MDEQSEGGARERDASRVGTAAAFAAYGLWGLFPIYWKLLGSVESLQILCHRIVWAAVLTVAALAATRSLGSLRSLFRDRARAPYAVAASLLITVNWGLYIWAVNSSHVTESSLGYYINPLVSVALGAIFFRDRLDKWTVAAVSVASAGVVAATVLMGSLPWISLSLAASFGLYGLVKKKAGLEPLVGLAAETLIVSPFALAFLAARHAAGAGAFLGPDATATVLLFLAGAVTAIPLLCFAAAANRITLTRMGFIQYVSPTIQLALGVFAFGERVSAPMAVAFVTVVAAGSMYVFTRRRRAG
jgi:chloramphenicol-sensitive protein RarD